MTPPGMHLAELNVGRLSAPTVDPRVTAPAVAKGRIVHAQARHGSARGPDMLYAKQAQAWMPHGCAKTTAV
ncbi:MAG: hypothetical protein IPL38_16130 [Rhodobacter sp.]|nr:hypothetical protein [Rhodobacter sp.]